MGCHNLQNDLPLLSDYDKECIIVLAVVSIRASREGGGCWSRGSMENAAYLYFLWLLTSRPPTHNWLFIAPLRWVA